MTNQTRTLLFVGILLLLAVVLGSSQMGRAADGVSASQFAASDRYGLRGLKGFYVQVDSLPYDVEKRGLLRQDLQRDAELRMRKAGALVLTREQAAESPNAPRLRVRILTSKVHNAPYYAYTVAVNFGQAATLTRDSSIMVDAITWSKVGMGMVKTKEVDEMRNIVGELVDEFLNAYLAENPRL